MEIWEGLIAVSYVENLLTRVPHWSSCELSHFYKFHIDAVCNYKIKCIFSLPVVLQSNLKVSAVYRFVSGWLQVTEQLGQLLWTEGEMMMMMMMGDVLLRVINNRRVALLKRTCSRKESASMFAKY